YFDFFTFDDIGYAITFSFAEVLRVFNLTVSAYEFAAPFDAVTNRFASGNCVEIVDRQNPNHPPDCVVFRVESPEPVKDVDFLGPIGLAIQWVAATDTEFPNPRLFQAHDQRVTFDSDITTVYCSNGFDVGCEPPVPFCAPTSCEGGGIIDAGIGGVTDNFS